MSTIAKLNMYVYEYMLDWDQENWVDEKDTDNLEASFDTNTAFTFTFLELTTKSFIFGRFLPFTDEELEDLRIDIDHWFISMMEEE